MLALAEVSLAADEGRTPDAYALILLFAPALLWFARGQLWAQPVPLELLVHTEIDLETGRVAVRELDR